MNEELLQNLLRSYGVLSCYTGYRYFIEAVCMAAEEPGLLVNIREGIYQPIAFNHGTAVESVVKDVRTIRDIIMKNDGGELLAKITGCPAWASRTPYPRELICIFAEYLIAEASAVRRPSGTR